MFKMLKTKRRWRALLGTWTQSHCPNSTTRFWWQEGLYGKSRLHSFAFQYAGTIPPIADFLTAETSSAARAAIKRLSLASVTN